ncbi:hypothetical protein SS05631_c02600 [Sinorhizobium sp. CCBAU 05631]|nr:hypothetical protein SS05631_c02600 [Sinorhizobium sp. CCBAU 05631]
MDRPKSSWFQPFGQASAPERGTNLLAWTFPSIEVPIVKRGEIDQVLQETEMDITTLLIIILVLILLGGGWYGRGRWY